MNRARMSLAVMALMLFASLWQWQTTRHQLTQSEKQLAQLEVHAQSLEARVVALETQLAEAKARSVDNLLDKSQQDFFRGWESLIDQFKDQLESARKSLQEKQQAPTKPVHPPVDEQT